jgi:hypothetical protein
MAERASGANRADDRCSASRMVWTMLFQTCWACPHAVDPLTFFSTDLARCVQGISRSEIIAPYVSESSPLVMCLAASIRTSLFVGRLRTFGVKHVRASDEEAGRKQVGQGPHHRNPGATIEKDEAVLVSPLQCGHNIVKHAYRNKSGVRNMS